MMEVENVMKKEPMSEGDQIIDREVSDVNPVFSDVTLVKQEMMTDGIQVFTEDAMVGEYPGDQCDAKQFLHETRALEVRRVAADDCTSSRGVASTATSRATSSAPTPRACVPAPLDPPESRHLPDVAPPPHSLRDCGCREYKPAETGAPHQFTSPPPGFTDSDCLQLPSRLPDANRAYPSRTFNW
ncbi:hypothetical protein GE061_009219 [Apolygus lucorum]|uniref:Uncharacterized protein n=1 Tax=Apolygus lucorum TaxID=248454 RepID=A0A8S9Y2A1_APOLU|nr:hypothetical protein GE061_009219 [Apolygus lucorum]